MIASVATNTIFVNGELTPAASGDTLPVVDPATGAAVGALSAGGAADVDRAVRSATAAFAGAWGRLAAVDRGRLLGRFGTLIAQHAERLAQTESLDTGKPISQARADIAAAVRYLEFYAGGADKLHGDTIPYLPGYAVQVLRVPVGVTGHIIPWNYPAQMFARSLAPSLAVGNATVIKPSEDASQSVVELAKLAAESGIPAGAINVVTGLGETAGDALARHPGVDLIDFIGSPQAGTLVQTAAAQHHARCISSWAASRRRSCSPTPTSVFVNCYGAGGGVELPFGGFKRSGHGRGKGFAAMHEFSTLQTLTQKFA